MSTLKSVVKSIAPLRKLAQGTKRKLITLLGDEISDDVFYTLSPDVLVAMVKAFNMQRQAAVDGRDLLHGHAYYEFGMFKGFSFWFAEQIAREYTDASFGFFGFDSFEGLPPPQLEVEARAFNAGDFRGSYERVTGNLRRWQTDLDRIKLYKGFYSEQFFADLSTKESFPPVSICLIDVDLYESTIPVLNFIYARLVVGSILLFDDYNQFGEDNNSGERRALIEFERRNPRFRKEHLFNYGWEGAAFRVVAV